MEKISDVLKDTELVKTIREAGKIYCLECDCEVEFFPTRKTANCPNCHKEVHRKFTETHDVRYVCQFCNKTLFVPYIVQVEGEYELHNVVCDNCEAGIKFAELSPGKNKKGEPMFYISFTKKYGKENDVPYFKRHENINKLIADAERKMQKVKGYDKGARI